jgi:hypothetical protein
LFSNLSFFRPESTTLTSTGRVVDATRLAATRAVSSDRRPLALPTPAMTSATPHNAQASGSTCDSDIDYSSSDDRPFSPRSASSYVPHQRVTVETELSSANKGYGLLVKMGWKGSGVGLGVGGSGESSLFSGSLPNVRPALPARTRKAGRRARW